MPTPVIIVIRIRRHEGTYALFLRLRIVISTGQEASGRLVLSEALCHARRNFPMFLSATSIFRVWGLYSYYCVHKSASVDPILSQTNPLNITKYSCFEHYVNITLLYNSAHHNVVRDFRLSQRCSSSGILHRVTGWLVPDVPRLRGGLVFKGRKI